MGGAPTGLNYAGVSAYLTEECVLGDDRKHVFACIRAAERAMLEVWREQAKERDQQRG